jgi:two-component system sensor histidine kinase RegB
MSFGTQSRLRREALAKMEEVMATEHELLSLGGQAAAAASFTWNTFVYN